MSASRRSCCKSRSRRASKLDSAIFCAVWYASNLLRARKTAEHLGKAGADRLEEDRRKDHQAADLRDVDADEVDQPILDERHVFVLRVEKLAHRDGDAYDEDAS